VPGNGSTVFINEFHYDDGGADANEFIEVAAPAGTNLTGYSLVLYNGSATSGASYDTLPLAGVVADQQNGYGVVSVPATGIQNGSPDGNRARQRHDLGAVPVLRRDVHSRWWCG